MKNYKKTLKITAYLMAVIAAGGLVRFLVIDPWKNKNKNNEIKEIYMKEFSEDEYEDETKAKQVSAKFQALQKKNSDIVGWVQIDNTVIDYPVVACDRKYYYLSHDFEKSPSVYGSIFVLKEDDVLSDECRHVAIHGHNMINGSMFASLLKFSNVDFYKKTPIITFDTLYEDSKWKIFSVFKTNTLEKHGKPFDYLVPNFDSDENFLKFTNEIKKRSLIDIPVDVNATDKILTLSTCSYEFEDFRTVVAARKVRTDESSKVDVSIAKKSTNPLMPDIYYNG